MGISCLLYVSFNIYISIEMLVFNRLISKYFLIFFYFADVTLIEVHLDMAG